MRKRGLIHSVGEGMLFERLQFLVEVIVSLVVIYLAVRLCVG